MYGTVSHLILKCFTEIEIFFLLLSDSWPKSQRERG